MTIKGVIVAGGYGTRFLPITRCVPKEMLPIVDRPAIDLVVEELHGAGVRDLLVITSRRKRALEDWFDRDPELESIFEGEGSQEKLAKIAPPNVRVTFVRQQRMAGTGDALMLAREFAGGDPIVVAYPDDLFGPPNVSARLVETHHDTGLSVLAAQDLVGEDVSRYGVLDADRVREHLLLRRIVEKPKPGEEPSTLVSWGRYLFTPELFPALERLRPRGQRGEYYHVDAVNLLAGAGRVAVEIVPSRRLDTGTPLGYLQAVVDFALERPDLGSAFEAWLRGRLSNR